MYCFRFHVFVVSLALQRHAPFRKISEEKYDRLQFFGRNCGLWSSATAPSVFSANVNVLPISADQRFVYFITDYDSKS